MSFCPPTCCSNTRRPPHLHYYTLQTQGQEEKEPPLSDARRNLDFHKGTLASRPDGAFIDTLHREWHGDYRRLELHHGYIQWLFPIRVRMYLLFLDMELASHSTKALNASSSHVCRMPGMCGGLERVRLLDLPPPPPHFALPLSIRPFSLRSPHPLSLASPLNAHNHTTQEPGMNSDAQPLTVAEREEIVADPACMARFVTSYEMQVGEYS